MSSKKFDNITNPTNFNVQVMANKGWRQLAAGEDTDAITRSAPNKVKAVGDGECYRAIYAPDGGVFTATPYNNKGDVITTTAAEGFMMPGLFERIQNTGATTIFISIA